MYVVDCKALSEHLNELVGSKTKNISAWNISLGHGQWSHPEPDVPESEEVWSSCGKGSLWYGWDLKEKIGSISTILPVSGRLQLHYGNCWNSGNVTVYLNGVTKSIAPANSTHSSKTAYFFGFN